VAWAEKGSKGYRGRYRDSVGETRDVRDGAGKIIYVASRKRARELALDEEAKIRAGTWWDPTAGAITFSDYFENHWRPNKVVELTTLRKYDDQYNGRNWGLKAYWGDVELRRVTRTSVQTWVARMRKAGLPAATIDARFKAFQTILAGGTFGTRRKGTSALREGLIASNPCIGAELPVLPRPEIKVYTPDQVEALIAAMDAWYRPIPLFLSETGVRWGELLGLQVDDFMLGFKAFTVSRTIIEPGRKYTDNGTPFMVKEYPKGRKRRRVVLSPEAATVVQTLIRDRQLGPADRLFTVQDGVGHGKRGGGTGLPKRTEAFPEGHPIARSNFASRVWHPAIEKAGLPLRTVHQLRSSNVSWMLAANVPLTTVMSMVGHEQFATTQRYTTTLDDDMYDEVVTGLHAVKTKFKRGQ
jgi:integrase